MSPRTLRALLLLLILTFTDINAEKIGVVGAGYVGLTMTAAFLECGHEVTCIDLASDKIHALKLKQLPIFEKNLSEIIFSKKYSQLVSFVNNYSEISNSDFFFICTNTPPSKTGECDLSSIYSALDSISLVAKNGAIVCIKSTIPPGTMKQIQEYMHNIHREDLLLVYNPEFMREGTALNDIFDINPIIIGGENQEAIDKIADLYSYIIDNRKNVKLMKMGFESAELIKYSWNGFSALRVTYINEISRLCKEYSADISEVISGISESQKLLPTSRIRPGPGYGGSCFPKDIIGLSKILEKNGIYPSLIHQTHLSNQEHISYVYKTIVDNLRNNEKEVKVCLLGLTYKAGTNDLRNAPSLFIIDKLIHDGFQVHVYDPLAKSEVLSLFPDVIFHNSPKEAMKNSDIIAVLTDWPEICSLSLEEYKANSKSKVLVDPRFIYNRQAAKSIGLKVL